MTPTPAQPPADSPSRSLQALLALTTFTSASSMHYQAPMLGAMGVEFGADAAAVAWVATMTFAGYLAGIVLIVPLGDRMDKRRLVLLQIGALLAACLAMAAAPSLASAAAISLAIGAAACVSQGVIPVLAELTPRERHGRVLGTLLTALFLGILFGRIAGGFIAAHLGWRWSYVLCAVLLAVVLPCLWYRLPPSRPKTTLGYGSLLRSLGPLWAGNRALQRAGMTQFLLGIGYGGFWATIASMMMLAHGLGPAQAGLIGIPGAMGVVIARPAGHWMDRRGAYPVVTTGIALFVAAFVTLQFGAVWLAALVVGAALMDCGLRGAMVANQTLVQTFSAEARSRVTTLFIAHIWAGNSVGAFVGSTAFKHWGWPAMCLVCMACAALALWLQLAARRAEARALG